MPQKTKRRILVVDDEIGWRELLENLLTGKGFSVMTVESATDALNAIARFTPDLILSDVRMPGMNGFELLENLKKNPSISSTPVVFLSAIDDYDARKTARDMGAADYLVKPFDEGDVSTLLQKHLPG